MLGPDESVYVQQADAVREVGFLAGLRGLALGFLVAPETQRFPSALRWLWIWVMALTPRRWVQIGSWAILGPLAVWALGVPWWLGPVVAASPLAWIMRRGLLQDVPVAALTLTCNGAALHHSPVGLAATLFCLLSCKEAALFVVPALLVAWPAGYLAVAVGCIAWAVVLFALFGRMTIPVLRAAKNGHATEYSVQNQRGAPHRLFVDLFLVSPLSLTAAIWFHNPIVVALTATLLAAHALAPVRNIRFVVAADILVRCTLVPWWMIPLMIAWDVHIAWRMRCVYDPVTQGLTGSLGMTTLT